MRFFFGKKKERKESYCDAREEEDKVRKRTDRAGRSGSCSAGQGVHQGGAGAVEPLTSKMRREDASPSKSLYLGHKNQNFTKFSVISNFAVHV